MGIYGEETDWGHSFCLRLKKAFEESGWEIFSEDYVPNTQSDPLPHAFQIQAGRGVSVIAGTITGVASMTGLIKQAREIGITSVIIADGLGWAGNWYELTGASANYVLDMIPQLVTPEAKAWADQVEKQYGFKPSPNAGGLVYDYARFFIKAAQRTLERFGKLDRASFQTILVEEVNTGKLTYGKADGAIIMQEYKFLPETMPDHRGRSGTFLFSGYPVLRRQRRHCLSPAMERTGSQVPVTSHSCGLKQGCRLNILCMQAAFRVIFN